MHGINEKTVHILNYINKHCSCCWFLTNIDYIICSKVKKLKNEIFCEVFAENCHLYIEANLYI